MGYVGNQPAEKYSSLTQQTFSSPTGTSFTLSQAVTSSTDIALFIDNVRQDPATYTATGTSLTTSTISSPSTMYCLFNGKTTETVSPPANSVDSGSVVSGAIDDSHITGMAASKLTGVVAPANLGTGTASASTFLNGAGAYAEAGGGFTLATPQATTSGTTFTFGSIPAGTTMIVVNFQDVSISASAKWGVQIGDAGGIEASGYSGGTTETISGTSVSHNETNKFVINAADTTATFSGQVVLSLLNSSTFLWTAAVTGGGALSGNMSQHGGGAKALTAELTQVKILGGTYDAGSVNVMYI
jgi:hypothetical protein